MSYKENPKTKGSGLICCIPQSGECPVKCDGCFFQSGKSYLEPLEDNLPNMPTLEQVEHRVVRVNDGNDSSVDIDKVIEDTKKYPLKFYNTSFRKNLDKFDAPVVLTLNPSKCTDICYHSISKIPPNLMFVRFRTNTWNLETCKGAVEKYTSLGVPVVLTFMAYSSEDKIPEDHRKNYVHRVRTLNPYYAISTEAWRGIMKMFESNKLVYSCGKIEGEEGDTKCKYCGNCLREFFATIERMEGS